MAVSKKDGELAMALIADYPLYCSTSGITYEEAIKVAKVIFGKEWKQEAIELVGEQ